MRQSVFERKKRNVMPMVGSVIVENKTTNPFVVELKEKLGEINNKAVDIVENVIEPIVEHALPMIQDTIEEFMTEPTEEKPSIVKETIKINTKEEVETEPEPIELDYEINSVILGDKILSGEECVLKISPLAKKEIKTIVSVSPIINKPLNVAFSLIDSDDLNSFSVFVRNLSEEDVNVTINYYVHF